MGRIAGRVDEALLRRRAADSSELPVLERITPEILRELSDREGVDFATALLHERFYHSERHGEFIRQIEVLRKSSHEFPKLPDVKVVIVPGALYRERPDLGGDGRLVRAVAEQFGYETDLIPLVSFGAVTVNARLIADWLRARPEQRMILVSLSKGGADLKLALQSPEAEVLFCNVVAWVNVCGPLDGTRMADWILKSRLRTWLFRWQCRWQKRDFALVTELSHAADAPLAGPLTLPSHLRMLNLVGFPLRQHMTTRHSRFCHRTLTAWGPNDGTVSLADVVRWPGEIFPVWGADHYFKPETLAQDLIAAMLRYPQLGQMGT